MIQLYETSVLEVAAYIYQQLQMPAVSADKICHILYSIQCLYGGQHEHRILMPASFIVGPGGPIEPNVVKAFPLLEKGVIRGDIYQETKEFIETFLKDTREKYSELSRTLQLHSPYQKSASCGVGTLIDNEALFQFYRSQRWVQAKKHVGVKQQEENGGRVMVNVRGEVVIAQKWNPFK